MAKSMLAVVHVDKRGTKKAVDDAIYNSGASNIRSAHVDFPKFGIAYDLSALDQHLTQEQCDALVAEATSLTRDPTAIRWVRTIDVSPQG
jgi:D-3-phosphoglycerate dehydrogenase